MNNDFIIGPTDTDSISFCKPDMSPFSKEEVKKLLNELREISPEFMSWEDDGYYPKCLVIRAKNYVLVNEAGERKIKGAALKDQKSSKKIIKFKLDLVDAILEEKSVDELIKLYHTYVKETKNITEVLQWSKKLTVTDKIFKCRGHETLTKEEKKLKKLRKNETDVYDAIKHKVFQEGDKVWLYYNNKDGLTLSEDFDGMYDREAFLRNLYTSLKIFKFVIDIDAFLNYTLKRNKEKLTALDEGN